MPITVQIGVIIFGITIKYKEVIKILQAAGFMPVALYFRELERSKNAKSSNTRFDRNGGAFKDTGNKVKGVSGQKAQKDGLHSN